MISEKKQLLIDKFLEDTLSKKEHQMFVHLQASDSFFQEELQLRERQALIEKSLEGTLNQAEQQVFTQLQATDFSFREELFLQETSDQHLKKITEHQQFQSNLKAVQAERHQKKPEKLLRRLSIYLLILIIGLPFFYISNNQHIPEAHIVHDGASRKMPKQSNSKPAMKKPQETTATLSSEPKKDAPKRADEANHTLTTTTKETKAVKGYYWAKIPEVTLYNGQAFRGTIEENTNRKPVKIYTNPPTPQIQAKLSKSAIYYYLQDHLWIYGADEKDINVLINDSGNNKYKMVVAKDTFLLRRHAPMWLKAVK